MKDFWTFHLSVEQGFWNGGGFLFLDSWTFHLFAESGFWNGGGLLTGDSWTFLLFVEQGFWSGVGFLIADFWISASERCLLVGLSGSSMNILRYDRETSDLAFVSEETVPGDFQA